MFNFHMPLPLNLLFGVTVISAKEQSEYGDARILEVA
jgi:hypothetical protein